MNHPGQYPEMNDILLVTIVKDQLKDRNMRIRYKINGFYFAAVDQQKWTATAWCVNSENEMRFSGDRFLTFGEAENFCQSKNSTLWFPKSSDFLEDPDFRAKFDSRKRLRFYCNR